MCGNYVTYLSRGWISRFLGLLLKSVAIQIPLDSQKLPYLREYKAHLFQPNIAFKIGVRIRFEGALDSSTNSNSIQLYRFLRNNV